jgi:hypothetical protein
VADATKKAISQLQPLVDRAERNKTTAKTNAATADALRSAAATRFTEIANGSLGASGAAR